MDDTERDYIIWAAADRWADHLANLLREDDFHLESDRDEVADDLAELEEALATPRKVG
jgi:hypothetical protein